MDRTDLDRVDIDCVNRDRAKINPTSTIDSEHGKLPMIIPVASLSETALDNLVAEYCLRDWGLLETESPLELRQQQVHQALKQGKLVVLYSEAQQTARLVPAEHFENQDC